MAVVIVRALFCHHFGAGDDDDDDKNRSQLSRPLCIREVDRDAMFHLKSAM